MSNLSPRVLSQATILIFLCLGWSRVTFADTTTITVLGLEAAAQAPETVATAITDALRQRAASSQGFQLVQGRDLVEVKLIYNCADEAPTCMTQAAQAIGAAKLVFGNVQPVGTESYLVTLKVLDAGNGVVESWVSEQIAKDQTNRAALRAPAQKWFATLTGQSLPGTVKITGGVVGASVVLDGIQSGALGADGLTMAGIAPGTHKLVVTKPGYTPFEREFDLASGGYVPVVVQMQPILTPPNIATPTPAVPTPLGTDESREILPDSVRNARIAAWAVFGVGLAGVGVGILSSYRIHDINNTLDPYRRYLCTSGTAKGLLACDDKGVFKDEITDPDVIKWRQDQYDLGNTYQKVQWIGYGLGGAALITSAILFYRGYATHQPNPSQTAHNSLVLVPYFGLHSAGAAALIRY
jgi:hypothetical protein